MYSIEFTPTNIHVIEADSSRKSVKVKNAFSAPMPQDVYYNGWIKDASVITKALRELLLSRNITKGQINFVLDSTLVKTKDAVVPDEQRQNILSILDREMADILLSEPHVLDYIVYNRYKENGKWYLNCVLYAIPREIIVNLLKLGEECGLHIKGVDFHHNVMAKLWELEEPGVRRDVPLTGAGRGILLAEKKEKKKSSIRLKKKKLDDLGQDHGEGEEVWKMPEAVHINQKIQLWVGLYQDSIKLITNAIDGNCYSRTVPFGNSQQDTLMLTLDTKKDQIMFFLDQIQAFLQFINVSNRSQPLEEIHMYGDFEDVEEVMDILRQRTSCAVGLLHMPTKISGISEEEYPVYCSAVGAMLRR